MIVGRKKGDNISLVNMVRQFTFNIYFHCCLLHVYSGCKLRFSFVICVLRPAKHKRQ